ncbi:MAG: AMP-binding protein, partial [Christensenellales bacterium]
MHSAGKSAEPKSIMLTNANFNSVAVNTKRAIVGEKAREKDAMAMVLPMFHAFGLGVCVHTVLSGGVKSKLIPRFAPERIVHYLKQGNITMISGVPTMYRGLVDK